jgi:hypothetical protein
MKKIQTERDKFVDVEFARRRLLQTGAIRLNTEQAMTEREKQEMKELLKPANPAEHPTD